MKEDSKVDAVMSAMPERARTRWCGGERGACACLGCVQVCNRKVILEVITGKEFRGDPEYISESALRNYPEIYEANKISREEWQAWMTRQGHSGA